MDVRPRVLLRYHIAANGALLKASHPSLSLPRKQLVSAHLNRSLISFDHFASGAPRKLAHHSPLRGAHPLFEIGGLDVMHTVFVKDGVVAY